MKSKGLEMEILIEDIPQEGLRVTATESEPWLADAMKDALGSAFAEGGRVELKLEIHRVEGNVSLEGTLQLETHPECDRCLTRFEERSQLSLHATLAPLYESRRQQEREEALHVEPVKEDLEFGFYEGDRFDLAEVVRENVVLEAPMQHFCREDCAGLCQKCGKNLNEGPCGCEGGRVQGSFEALKHFRLKGKNEK